VLPSPLPAQALSRLATSTLLRKPSVYKR